MSTPDPFTPLPLFAFPLFVTMVAGHEQHKEPLTTQILDLRSKYPGMKRSNRNAWHSGDEFLQIESDDISWLLQNVMAYGRRALGRYYQDWATTELRLGRFWGNVVGAGGWNAPHHHFPAHWSGVYYVSVGQLGTSADDLSGLIEFLNPTPWQALWGRSGNFVYGPREGLMLLFPSSLVHFVHPHASDDLRISIAFNLNVAPK